MNAVFLITRYNHEGILRLIRSLAEKQELPNTGKGLIMGGYYLPDEILQEAGQALKGSFEVVELAKVQVNEKASPASQNATMIATWMMQRYTSIPGPWTIFDEETEIIMDNPLSILERLHNAGKAENTGRASTLGGGRVPVGPVVIGALAKRLRMLVSVSGEDWRSRGRWQFNVCSWCQIPTDEYPFRLVAPVENEAESGDSLDQPKPQTEVTSGQKKDSLPEVKSNDVPEPGGVGKAGAMPVALADAQSDMSTDDLIEAAALGQDKTPQQIYEERIKAEENNEPRPGDPNYVPPEGSADLTDEEAAQIPQHPGAALEDADPPPVMEEPAQPKREIRKPFIRVDASKYHSLDDDELRNQIYHRSGRKAHPATKTAKLIKKLEELDAEAAEAGKQ